MDNIRDLSKMVSKTHGLFRDLPMMERKTKKKNRHDIVHLGEMVCSRQFILGFFICRHPRSNLSFVKTDQTLNKDSNNTHKQ